MRRIAGWLATAGLPAAIALAGEVLAVSSSQAACSVFDQVPCAATVCSVFHRGPCLPEFEPPIGQDLRLTIRSAAGEPDTRPHARDNDGAEPKLSTIADLFSALRACWTPAPPADVPPDMQMSVRLSFRRDGELIGAPRETYVSAGAPPEARERFRDAVLAALDRCQPLPFTTGLAGAIAGRPIAIRFIENGTLHTEKP